MRMRLMATFGVMEYFGSKGIVSEACRYLKTSVNARRENRQAKAPVPPMQADTAVVGQALSPVDLSYL